MHPPLSWRRTCPFSTSRHDSSVITKQHRAHEGQMVKAVRLRKGMSSSRPQDTSQASKLRLLKGYKRKHVSRIFENNLNLLKTPSNNRIHAWRDTLHPAAAAAASGVGESPRMQDMVSRCEGRLGGPLCSNTHKYIPKAGTSSVLQPCTNFTAALFLHGDC